MTKGTKGLKELHQTSQLSFHSAHYISDLFSLSLPPQRLWMSPPKELISPHITTYVLLQGIRDNAEREILGTEFQALLWGRAKQIPRKGVLVQVEVTYSGNP
jgi:hypothetical protein